MDEEVSQQLAVSLASRVGVHRVAVFAAEDWAVRAADLFADAIDGVLCRQERCTVALSGGTTPAPVLAELATRKLAWDRVTLTQVDERIAAMGSGNRNIVGLRAAFSELPVTWIPLPVEEDDLVAAGNEFLEQLSDITGSPPTLDLVHLGLGGDGHTASLVPDDPILRVVDRDIGTTGFYQGTRRLTMTRPMLERALLVLWLVAGPTKADAVKKLLRCDQSIPAGQLDLTNSVVVLDAPAISGGIA